MSREEERNSHYLGELAKIDLTSEEEQTLNGNLEKILGYMKLLDEVDTQGVLPCTHVLETIQNVMEEDEERPVLSRETFLQNAPESIAGLIKVPPVLQQEE